MNQFFLNATTSPAPSVISISYGQPISTLGQDFSTILAADAGFAALGLAGITVVVSSGDNGANLVAGSSSFFNFTGPMYPASSPYVLTVGGTEPTQVHDALLPALQNPQSPICKGGFTVQNRPLYCMAPTTEVRRRELQEPEPQRDY